jgi:hypothetical protein
LRRDLAHRDVDAIFDRLPTIEDLARYGRGGSRGPKGTGTISDPTGMQATRGGRDREFIEMARDILKRLSAVAAEAMSLAPAPARRPMCVDCGTIIDERPKVANGLHHERCYRKARRNA